MQLAKSCEKFTHVICCDAYTSVDDMGNQLLVIKIVANLNLNQTLVGEFLCILKQIDQNLLKSSFVTQQPPRQLRLNSALV